MIEIRAGLHSSLNKKLLKDRGFSIDEISIITKLSYLWFVTKAEKIKLSMTTSYRYVLIKPTEELRTMLNIEKEIGVIFSDFDSLEPRTLDAFDKLTEELATWRMEKICSVLISKDSRAENRVSDFIKTDTEARIIVPFSYEELLNEYNPENIIKNKFRKYFYDRDLFSFNSPLKKDVYFFGRKDLIHSIISRHKTNENSGLFGLRKTGKTSVIYAIQRELERENNSLPVIIDCQDPSFNIRRWNKALYYLCLMAYETTKKQSMQKNKKFRIKEPKEDLFTLENASLETIKHLKEYKLSMKDKIFFIFDEIENISIKTSPVAHWKSGEDFIPFWQTLRSIFQKETDLLSYLIIGTNPYSIEQASINGSDNPIYNFITPEYIPGFTSSDIKEMVDKLGSIMGLEFEDSIFAKLTEDFGGHPFLIRQVCGFINSFIVKEKINKPARIDRLIYQKAKENFVQNNQNYIDMILNVLSEYYKDEYEMLEYLAIGNIEDFNLFAEDISLTNHLLGYGILAKNDNNEYDFKVDLIKNYIAEKNKYKKQKLTVEDKLKEISERRNKLEPKLRNLIKTILLSNLGKNDAKEFVLNIFGGVRKNKLQKLSYSDLFDAKKSEIYFSDLSKIISKKWDLFKNLFSESKQDVFQRLESINKYRNDAHAKDLTEEEFILFRIAIERVEKDLEE